MVNGEICVSYYKQREISQSVRNGLQKFVVYL